MKTNVTVYNFRDAFQGIRPDNFSYEGLSALYDYLTELEEACDTEIELDVIAICCDFSEYKSATEAVIDGGYSLDFEENEEERMENEALEWLRERTQVIEFNGGIIIQNF